MADLFQWLYNSNTGAVQDLPLPVATFELHSGLGWHGPFPTKQAALDYYTRNKDKNPGWKAPTGITGNITNAVDTAKDKIAGLNLDAWFVRVGEILIGVILIGVGIAKLTGTSNIIASAVKAKI